MEEKLEEKKQVERQDNPPNLIFGASTTAPIAGSLFDTATHAPATGGLFGTSGATKLPPTSIFEVKATKPVELGKELPEKKSIQGIQEYS